MPIFSSIRSLRSIILFPDEGMENMANSKLVVVTIPLSVGKVRIELRDSEKLTRRVVREAILRKVAQGKYRGFQWKDRKFCFSHRCRPTSTYFPVALQGENLICTKCGQEFAVPKTVGTVQELTEHLG